MSTVLKQIIGPVHVAMIDIARYSSEIGIIVDHCLIEQVKSWSI